jgi:hypothetical protein
MSEEQSNEREAKIKATDDPEVEGHAKIKIVQKANDDPELDEEPDVQGHAMTKSHVKSHTK